MGLSEYTIEELREEIKRRNKETIKLMIKEKPKYIEWTAKVLKVEGNFYKLCDSSIPIREWEKFSLKQGIGFNKSNKPKVGDIVKLSYRNGKGYTCCISHSKIIEVVKKEIYYEHRRGKKQESESRNGDSSYSGKA